MSADAIIGVVFAVVISFLLIVVLVSFFLRSSRFAIIQSQMQLW